jgi:hypothetical protein
VSRIEQRAAPTSFGDDETSDPAVDQMETQIISPNGGGQSSLIDQLREMRAQKAAAVHHDLEVPGYRGCLVLRLGPLGSSVIGKLRERAERSASPDRDLNANSDCLIAGCREVLARTSRESELEPIDPEHDGPTRIDEHLAELLQLGTTTARASLLALWDKANAPEIAIGMAAGEYVEWCAETQVDIDEEFVGKA